MKKSRLNILLLIVLGFLSLPAHAIAKSKTFTLCPDCPDMVTIPQGTFQMGDVNRAGEKDENPVRRVSVPSFSMAIHEVSVAEFESFVSVTGYDTGSSCWTHENQKTAERKQRNWQNPGFTHGPTHPVTCLNWNDAMAYIAWFNKKTGNNYRLPSEAEWEYAARAGTTTEYYWGDDIEQGCRYANIADAAAATIITHAPRARCNDGFATASPVGHYLPNAYGLHDMLGNVFEWVQDCYLPEYNKAPSDGSAIGEWACQHPKLQGRRVTRGGSWYSRPIYVRSADRNLDDHPRRIGLNFNVSNRAANVGFRLAHD